ncbi:RUS1 family protein C16orf58 homolog isoform X1 [Carcharodon carcharias]|uniref:RUS1 family protein C16orf58 homolog isoform X1 n=1 Tax=Carcharodon carcharias TaxID=13397 RepID=UPI001B7E9FCE|nr:RUS1 family protein C16orf58 homolog isoform X1 [Carcharodon carcharias]
MAGEEAKILCSEHYGARRDRRYVQQGDGQLLRRSERGPEAALSLASLFTSVFLPQGYPDSVSGDYLSYQIWDTVQAFASSITGTLATQAILKGVGVGDSTATITAASMTWILKDGTGMVGRILFAWLKGSRLDCDAKKWRLFADGLNDLAIFMEIIAPAFPSIFILIVCVSGVFKSVVGVSGGATRAALTMHQARRDNMADVSAKDGSQETLVNLAGLLFSLILTPLATGNILLTYLLYALFTMLHLYANYQAVRAVVMDTLNQSRLRLMVNEFLRTGRVPPPRSINPREPLLPAFQRRLSIRLGTPLHSILNSAYDYQRAIENNRKNYLLGLNRNTGVVCVSLRDGAGSVDMIEAGFHAELLDELLHRDASSFRVGRVTCTELQAKLKSERDERLWDTVAATHLLVDQLYPRLLSEARAAGWLTERNHLGADEWRAQWPLEGKKGQ